MDSLQPDPSPAARNRSTGASPEKLKKALLYIALAGVASWGAAVPLLAEAGIFDIAGALLPRASSAGAAPAAAYNSQTMPLLSPAKNIDPQPSVGGGDISMAGGALIPQEGPSGTAADIEQRPEATQISVHVVRETKPGENPETLSTIAELYGVSVNTIRWANDIKKGDVIHPGQELVILPVSGVYHTVAKSDTLASLAKKYNANEAEIREHNDLAGGLTAGEKILIPNGTIAAAPAPRPASRPAASSAGSAAQSSGGSPYGWPVAGGVVTQGVHGYNGIDIGAPAGTPIYASAAGEVIVARAGGYNGGYGSYVVIQHQHSQTLYAHMSAVLVSAGETVAKGQSIGRVGTTGKSTGNHLHFEVRGAANPFR